MARHRHDPFKDLVGFLVGDVMYAVRIDVVREIVNPLTIVDLPQAPSSVKGVADYRGEVVPVIDLRERFGLPPVASSRKTKWIVLDVSGGRNPNGARRQVFGRQTAASGAGSAGSSSGGAGPTGAPLLGGGHADAAMRLAQGASRMAGQGSPMFVGMGQVGPPAAASDGRAAAHARYAALVVDAMTEVFGLAGGELRPAPPLGDEDGRQGIEGVTTLGSRLVFVLDARSFGGLTQAAVSPGTGTHQSSRENA